MPAFMGKGGVVWELDVPAEGTIARERFDQQVADGDLVPVDEPKPRARKAAAED